MIALQELNECWVEAIYKSRKYLKEKSTMSQFLVKISPTGILQGEYSSL